MASTVARQSFYVGHWRVTYRTTSIEAASEVRDLMDKKVHEQLSEACSGRLAYEVASDSSVWLIRHLELALALSPRPADAANSARQWGEQLAANVRKIIDRGEENESILHFSSRAAYIAQFVRDLAAGRAHGKWYYDEFSPLLSLPLSRAILGALSGQGENIGDLLISLLAIHGLRDVLQAMADSDVHTAFDMWQQSNAQPESPNESAWVVRLLAIWNESPLRDSSDHPFRDGLWWAALAISRHPGGGSDGPLLEAIRSLLGVRSVFGALDFASRERVLQQLKRGDIEGAAAAATRHGIYDSFRILAFFHRNMQGDEEWARSALGVLLGENEYIRSARSQVFPRGPAIPSPFAGIFRLGPSFLSSGLADALVSLDSESAAAFRHLVAVKCIGRENSLLSFPDPALRVFSGFQGADFADLPDFGFVASPPLPGDMGFFSLAGTIAGISDAIDHAATAWAHAVLSDFARRLIGFEPSSPGYVYRNLLTGNGSVCDTGEKITAEISPPPLAIVLSIAGILEESYTLPWIEGREICVRRSQE